MLSEFDGTLLFVSHDRYFIDNLATKVWEIEQSILTPYQGNYTEYRTRRQQVHAHGTQAASASKTHATKKQTVASNKSGNKKAGKEKVRTIEAVERDVEKAETHIKSVEEALSQAALQANAEQLRQLASEYEQAKAHVDALLEEWEQVSDMVS